MPESIPDANWRRRFRRRLLNWFASHARDLPWRRTSDPYAIWVSEIMLQQTQVATVIPFFERFLAKFPDIATLAGADEAEVLRVWEGLGYYRRARQMHRAAQQIQELHGGVFPTSWEAVHALPGIGRYTAGAILSIAHDLRHPILEANTQRLYSRLIALEGDPRAQSGQQKLWQFAQALLPRKRSGDLNQALMELGSEICSPRNPRCLICPVESLCAARQQRRETQIPQRPKRPRIEEVHEICVVVWRQGRVLLRRRGDQERWAGMWDFPRFEAHDGKDQEFTEDVVRRTKELTGVTCVPGEHLIRIRHGVTRFRITLDCYEGRFRSGKLDSSTARWVRPQQLEGFPLSVTGRKIAKAIARA